MLPMSLDMSSMSLFMSSMSLFMSSMSLYMSSMSLYMSSMSLDMSTMSLDKSSMSLVYLRNTAENDEITSFLVIKPHSKNFISTDLSKHVYILPREARATILAIEPVTVFLRVSLWVCLSVSLSTAIMSVFERVILSVLRSSWQFIDNLSSFAEYEVSIPCFNF